MSDYLEKMSGYSKFSSWAVWESNREDGKFLKEADLKEDMDFKHYNQQLQTSNKVILAMNPGGDFNEDEAKKASRKVEAKTRPWSNFHNVGKSRDFALADAIKDTPLWGSYMTDFLPVHGSKSDLFNKFEENDDNQDLINNLVLDLDEELAILFDGPSDVDLFCVGRDTERWAEKYLVNKETLNDDKLQMTYKVYYLPHYSFSNISNVNKLADKYGLGHSYGEVVKKILADYGI